ncbi:hypothetical protein BDD12DRAFT_808519 [Trichophaea hybrida]|nr:hypothetical protein BDD12DRAFT_808519 [Trichophaea hybrida]
MESTQRRKMGTRSQPTKGKRAHGVNPEDEWGHGVNPSIVKESIRCSRSMGTWRQPGSGWGHGVNARAKMGTRSQPTEAGDTESTLDGSAHSRGHRVNPSIVTELI